MHKRLNELAVGTRFRFADGEDTEIVHEVAENNDVRVMVRALLPGWRVQPVSNVAGDTLVETEDRRPNG